MIRKLANEPGLSDGINIVIKVLGSGRRQRKGSDRCDVKTIQLTFADCETDGGTGREPGSAGSLHKLEKAQKQIPRKECDL